MLTAAWTIPIELDDLDLPTIESGILHLEKNN